MIPGSGPIGDTPSDTTIGADFASAGAVFGGGSGAAIDAGSAGLTFGGGSSDGESPAPSGGGTAVDADVYSFATSDETYMYKLTRYLLLEGQGDEFATGLPTDQNVDRSGLRDD